MQRGRELPFAFRWIHSIHRDKATSLECTLSDMIVGDDHREAMGRIQIACWIQDQKSPLKTSWLQFARQINQQLP